MINTDCLNRINHHHHYHEFQTSWSSSSETSKRKKTTNLLAKMSKNSKILATNSNCGLSTKMTRNNHSSRHNRISLKPSSRISSSFSIRTLNGVAFFAITLAFIMTIILITLTREVHSLNCYTCSSADDPGCDESFSGRANITNTDCEKQIGKPAKVCRKIVQYIESKKVVIRSCGWIDERSEMDKKSMCYKRSGTFALMMESCVCYEDNCNHSAGLVPNQSVLLLLTGCSIIYYYTTKRSARISKLVS